jgi:hypothetical protein
MRHHWASGHQGIRASGHQGIRASGHQGIRASGHQGIRASGHQGIRASGHQGIRASGHQGIRASGHQGILKKETGLISPVHFSAIFLSTVYFLKIEIKTKLATLGLISPIAKSSVLNSVSASSIQIKVSKDFRSLVWDNTTENSKACVVLRNHMS